VVEFVVDFVFEGLIGIEDGDDFGENVDSELADTAGVEIGLGSVVDRFVDLVAMSEKGIRSKAQAFRD
jgi:hypothetical protein